MTISTLASRPALHLRFLHLPLELRLKAASVSGSGFSARRLRSRVPQPEERHRAFSDSAATRSPSSGRGLKDRLHVAVGSCGCLLRTAAVLTRAQVGRVPVPPVVRSVRLLIVVVVLRCFAEELCEGCDVDGSCSRRLTHAAWKPRLNLLEQPAVPIRILERGEREVGTTLRVTPADAWVLHSVVEGTAGVVENLAHLDASGDQVVAGGVEVVHREDHGACRARLGRCDSLT